MEKIYDKDGKLCKALRDAIDRILEGAAKNGGKYKYHYVTTAEAKLNDFAVAFMGWKIERGNDAPRMLRALGGYALVTVPTVLPWVRRDRSLKGCAVVIRKDGRFTRRAVNMIRWLTVYAEYTSFAGPETRTKADEEGNVFLHLINYKGPNDHCLLTAQYEFAINLFKALRVPFIRGNDAPRGGRCGDWIKVNVRCEELRRALDVINCY